MSDVNELLQPLFQEAREKGLWFYTAYQGLWFSPDELEAANRNGRFRWGPVNWKLRDPSECVAEAEAAAQLAEAQVERVRARVKGKSV